MDRHWVQGTSAGSAEISGYETVSAFSNTHGCRLVFGVRQVADEYEIAGVANVDKVQGDFLSDLHADNKVNHDVPVERSLIQVGGKAILVFRVPEAPRQHKALYSTAINLKWS